MYCTSDQRSDSNWYNGYQCTSHATIFNHTIFTYVYSVQVISYNGKIFKAENV